MNDLHLSVGLLMRPFVPRNPFSYSRLPLLSRLQLAAFRARRRAERRLIGKPARNIYKLARALGLKGRGGLTINAGDSVYEVAFDASNTQFVPAEDAVYEPELAALLDIVLDDDGVFFDIGSNWGYFSFYTLSRKSFRGIVHAFEPYPTNHRNLNDTANQCGFGPKLICHEVALSDHDSAQRQAAPSAGLTRDPAAGDDGAIAKAIQAITTSGTNARPAPRGVGTVCEARSLGISRLWRRKKDISIEMAA